MQILIGGMLAPRMAGCRGNPGYAEPSREETGSDRNRRAGPYFKRNSHLFVGGENLPNRPASERSAAADIAVQEIERDVLVVDRRLDWMLIGVATC